MAERLGAEIISVDSMQVYRGMDVGTAKPTMLERREVVHHMIDVVEPEDEFSVAEFRRLGRQLMAEDGPPVLITGGSGLHFRSLVDPMNFAPTDEALRSVLEEVDVEELVEELTAADPDSGRHVDLSNPRRVIRAVEIFRLTSETPSSRAATAERRDVTMYKSEVDFKAVGVDPGAELDERIRDRLHAMRSEGLLDEVNRLQGRLGRTAARAVGYRELTRHLSGELSIDDAFAEIERNTRRLAKKQRTWFHRDPRVEWIPWLETESDRTERVLRVLA